MLVVFDGVCNFCNSWVRFVLERDNAALFRFAAAQSVPGAAAMRAAGLDPNALQTILLVDGDRYYKKSDAVLEILSRLGWPWRAAGVLRVVPKGFRDSLYRLFARKRYALFGARVACPAPPQQWRNRFET